jgi:hypothetical protein
MDDPMNGVRNELSIAIISAYLFWSGVFRVHALRDKGAEAILPLLLLHLNRLFPLTVQLPQLRGAELQILIS